MVLQQDVFSSSACCDFPPVCLASNLLVLPLWQFLFNLEHKYTPTYKPGDVLLASDA